MDAIGVKNFRSIKDSGKIELKPVTAVVGRNSSGKSSFIRLFPLLKQTVEKRISDSMLWYGDYVDFGDFEHVISRRNCGESIEFFLSFQVNEQDFFYYGNYDNYYHVKLTVVMKKEYIEKTIIQIEDQLIEIEYEKDGDVNGISINGVNDIFDCTNLRWNRQVKGFIPLLQEKEGDVQFLYGRFRNTDVRKKTIKLIYGFQYEKDDYRVLESISNIKIGSKSVVLEGIKNMTSEVLDRKRDMGNNTNNKNDKIRKKISNMKVENKTFLKIDSYVLATRLGDIIENINNSLLLELNNTNYVKPIRAMVDRYYRVQGISIDELDSDGSNIPMILYNMSPEDLSKFEIWCKEKFDVIFSVDNSVGHVSLVIKENFDSNEKTNLADTGYGYSQMLPIIVLLWMLHNKNNKNRSRGRSRKVHKTIVIEQPELHLHPAYQAKMVEVFVNVIKDAKDYNIDLKIIFETHSEAMVNRLGYLINQKKLEEDWVNILIFDKENGKTSITSKEFNDKGLLKGWPIGFFAPDEV